MYSFLWVTLGYHFFVYSTSTPFVRSFSFLKSLLAIYYYLIIVDVNQSMNILFVLSFLLSTKMNHHACIRIRQVGMTTR
ncbi:unnamed protein product [Rotaria socialis]